MSEFFKLVNPRFAPPLDEEFRPAVLANRMFQSRARTLHLGQGYDLVIVGTINVHCNSDFPGVQT